MTRAARTVGIAIDEELRSALDEVVEHYAGGNRSEFLRRAVRDYQGRLRMERMTALRSRAREQGGGRVLTPEEIMALVRDHATEAPRVDPT